MGVSHDNTAWAWLGGGSIAEPNFYINMAPNERRSVEDLVLPVGTRPATPAPAPAAAHSPDHYRCAGGARRRSEGPDPAGQHGSLEPGSDRDPLPVAAQRGSHQGRYEVCLPAHPR